MQTFTFQKMIRILPSTTAASKSTEIHRMDALRVCLCVMLRLLPQMSCLGHWGALLRRSHSSGAEQGPSHCTQFEQVERTAGRQRCSVMGGGRQGPKALRPGSGSNYTRGAWRGEWHPLEWRRRAVCGDVRRRKKPSKPDKASEEQCEDCRRKKRKRRERRSFHQGNTHWWILWHFASDNCPLVPFKPPSHLLHSCKLSIELTSALLENTGHVLRPRRNLVTGRKVSGGHRYGFSELFFCLKDNAWKVGFLCMALDYAACRVWNISSVLSWCRLIVE